MYLEQIQSPKDVKKIEKSNLPALAEEMRRALLEKVSRHGGHIGPNLGMMEATIALHYVFDSPTDKIVFDVSHQSYGHKMLTGRKDAFLLEEHYDDVTGYTNPGESEHDFFTVGHTSTSISLACGLAKARDLKREKGNVIAVIGDGSLSGGEALEGLDFAKELDGNLIIIVNDNQMSIAENHGGIYHSLKELRESDGTSGDNIFGALGLDYVFIKEGNDVAKLIDVFEKVKDIAHPIIVHICTQKGKGYKFAEENKEAWHYNMPFDLDTGSSVMGDMEAAESYDELTAEFLLEKMKSDPTVAAITAGTAAVFGFSKARREQAGRQFIDVGIAEEHAVAMASGMAANGGKPVFGVYSSFVQRTYDQLSQDLCINRNPALLLVFAASVYGMNDVTHLGLFDIPLLSNIPNLVYLAPTCKEEYMAMLAWGIEQKEYPAAIRVPANGVIESGRVYESDFGELNRYQITKKGSKVAVLALGSFYQLGGEVEEYLHNKYGINATVINPRYITGLDETVLESLKAEHQAVITLEDGILDGGFGEKISRFYGSSDMKVMNYGFRKEFVDRYAAEELMKENRLTAEQICEDLTHLLKL